MVEFLRKTMMVLRRLGGAGVDVGAAMALSGKASEVTVVNAVDTEVSPEAGEVLTMGLEVVTVGLEVVTVVVSGEASEETEGAVEVMEIGEEMVVAGAAVVVAFTKRHEVPLLHHEIRVCRYGPLPKVLGH